MPLSMAMTMQREERKWAGMSSQKKAPAHEPCRYGDGTCLGSVTVGLSIGVFGAIVTRPAGLRRCGGWPAAVRD